ncbi:hypothetical protein JCM13664_08290 [Methylothermus subterraneus]
MLYVTRTQSFRLDANSQGEALGEIEAVEKLCEGADDLLEVVEHAFRARPPGRRLWLLYEGLETHSLALPAAQVHGVGAAALTQALCFEIEALTGASVVNRQLGYVLTTSPDEEMRSYWASLLPQRLFERLEKEVRGKGAKLAAVLHPGGIPLPLTQAVEPPWRRVEYWPEVVICLAVRRRGEPQEVLVIPTEGLTRAAERELAEWLADHPGSVFWGETLRADHKLTPNAEEPSLDLGSAEGLTRWLGAWAKVLAQRENYALPLVQATARVEKEIVYLVASGVAGLMIVALHAGWQTYLKRDYESQIQQLEAIQKQMDEYNQGIKARNERLAAADKTLALLEQSGSLAGVVEKLRRRPARLLAALALARSPQIVITELEIGAPTWAVGGVSVDFSAPNAYAGALEEALRPLGIKVNPPAKASLQENPGGENRGPWRFKIELGDLSLGGMRDGVVR